MSRGIRFGGTAGISVNRKKTDTDLRKDAEAATSEEIVRLYL